MDAWLRDLILNSVNGIKALADAAWQRIQWVYNIIVAVGLGVKNGWSYLYGMSRYALRQLALVAQEQYVTLYWLVWIRIPQAINNATDRVVSWTARTIQELRDYTSQYFALVIDWATRKLNGLIDRVTQLGEWALRTVNEIIDTLTRVAALVFTLLTSPERMAKWLLAALLNELLTVADEQADRILDWIRRRSVFYAGRVAARVEDVLARML